MKIKKGIPENLREGIIAWSYQYFSEIISKNEYIEIIEVQTNWDISAMLVDSKDEDDILGVYLIGDSQLPIKMDIIDIDTLVGVEGVLLVIDEPIRGMGWGDLLKNYPKTLGVDYIWGQQLKSLNNLSDWLKRRTLVCETKDVYITAEFFNI